MTLRCVAEGNSPCPPFYLHIEVWSVATGPVAADVTPCASQSGLAYRISESGNTALHSLSPRDDVPTLFLPGCVTTLLLSVIKIVEPLVRYSTCVSAGMGCSFCSQIPGLDWRGSTSVAVTFYRQSVGRKDVRSWCGS